MVLMRKKKVIPTVVLTTLLTIATMILLVMARSSDAITSSPDHQAIAELLERAASYVERGQLDQGGATLERALRLAPRDTELWHRLAEVRLLQGKLEQAEAMATKSNQLTDDPNLRARNDGLIAAAMASVPPAAPTSSDLNRLAVEIERRRQAEMRTARLEEELAQERARRQQAEAEVQAAKAAALQHAERVQQQRTESTPTVTHAYPRSREQHVDWADDEPTPEQETHRASRIRQSRPHLASVGRVPFGHLPPPGKCRIWFANRPAGHQPPPGDCQVLSQRIPRGAHLVSRN